MIIIEFVLDFRLLSAEECRKEKNKERMRKLRAKEAEEKMLSNLLENLVFETVQKVEKHKARKEDNRKRKALERENETQEEKNYRLDKEGKEPGIV